MRGHGGQLVVVLTELDPRDVVGLGVGGHRPTEPVTDLVEQRGRGERVAQVPRQERHHPRTGLQPGHIGVEVDAVQTLDIQRHVPVENVVDRHHTPAHDRLRIHSYKREDVTTTSGNTRPVTRLGGPRRRLTGTPTSLGGFGVGRGVSMRTAAALIIDGFEDNRRSCGGRVPQRRPGRVAGHPGRGGGRSRPYLGTRRRTAASTPTSAVQNTISAVCKLISFRAVFEPVA
jgi:hypothetical protein